MTVLRHDVEIRGGSYRVTIEEVTAPPPLAPAPLVVPLHLEAPVPLDTPDMALIRRSKEVALPVAPPTVVGVTVADLMRSIC